jgi:hypothetical protein
MIRVELPHHLRTLARVGSEVTVDVAGEPTLRSVFDALEARYPMLRGTIRDHVTRQRRPFLRFFACEEDLSHEPPDAPLPAAVVAGNEPLYVVGAIADPTCASTPVRKTGPTNPRIHVCRTPLLPGRSRCSWSALCPVGNWASGFGLGDSGQNHYSILMSSFPVVARLSRARCASAT